jgi:lipopolysaccharide export LptBFGC system permease protein LptF
MNAVVILLAVSASVGLLLGSSYSSWIAVGFSGMILAFFSAVVLQRGGFGASAGIAIIVALLTVNQVAFLIGAFLANRGRR